MRLLLVTQDFPPDTGGIETYASELAPRLADRCDRFLLIAPDRPGADRVDASLDYPIRRLPIRPDLLALRALFRVPQLGWTEKFDTAFHLHWPTVYPSLVSRWLTGFPKRIAATVNGKDTVFNPFKGSIFASAYDALRRTSLFNADRILPYSRFLAQQARRLGVPDERIEIVPFGTDPGVFYPEEVPELRRQFDAENRPIILSAGRLVRKKGFGTAIRALDDVVETLPNVLLLIAGDGPERERLGRLVRKLGLENNVQFLGTIPHSQIRTYYNLADVFLMAGHRESDDIEGFGLVYLEANACGTPTIGARVGGVPDAVRDGETGLLVPPKDPAATADALIRLLTDSDLADRLGSQGRQRVLDEANWDDIADRLIEALNRPQSPGSAPDRPAV